jgi:hypothetical protein
MGVAECCRSIYFLLTTLLTVGFVLAILIAGFVFGEIFKIFQYDKNLLVYLIIAMVGVLFVFFLFLWISCRRTKGGRSILSVVFLLLDLALFIISIVAFVQRGTVINKMPQLWEGGSGSQTALAASLESAFGCCGWDNASQPADENCAVKHKDSGPCHNIIQPKLEKYWNLGAGLMLGFAVVLLVMVVFAFRLACKTVGYDQMEDPPSVPTMGHGATSRTSTKPSYKYTW